MKKLFIVVVCILLLVSCSKKETIEETAKEMEVAETTTDLSTLDAVQKYYYAMGNYIAYSYGSYYSDMDVESFAKGAMDYGKGVILTQEQQETIVNDYVSQLNVGNREKAEQLLAENAQKEGVITTESGLQYQVLVPGTGESAADANTVTVDYELVLTDGTIADSSIQRGTPAQFSVSGVIRGFAEGIKLMHVGETCKIWVHPDLGYGPTGTGNIPGNELLTFTISLLSIDN